VGSGEEKKGTEGAMVCHHPVLAEEVIAYLRCGAGKRYVDCTLGGGGHAALILERTAPDGRLLGIEWDGKAIRLASERLRPYGGRVVVVRDVRVFQISVP